MLKTLFKKLLGIDDPTKRRLEFCKKRGMKVGNGCAFLSGVWFDPDHCQHISIGDNCTLAPNVSMIAHDASTKRHLGYTRIGKICIGNKVFIGASSIILPNVCIGDNSIIGAGSVVTRTIPANVVAAGNPCRVICDLKTYLEKNCRKIESMLRFDAESVSAEMYSLMVDGEGFIP